MQPLQIVFTVVHIIASAALIITVLMQHGKQQGLSGAIAGGAETFFGKNKGRTIDAMLRRITAFVAGLFIVTSVGLYLLTNNTGGAALPDNESGVPTDYMEGLEGVEGVEGIEGLNVIEGETSEEESDEGENDNPENGGEAEDEQE